MRVLVLVLALMVGAAVGCGDDGPVPDAGGDTRPSVDSSVPGVTVDPPMAPAPPVLVPCPAGWTEVAGEGGAMACDPWPSSGPATCPPEQAHFIGTPGCVTVGSACPSGDFPDDLPLEGRVFYVLSGASVGGDGSIGSPFDTIGGALAVAGAGDTVAVGRGDYDEVISPRTGITVWGACAAETTLRTSAPSAMAGVIEAAVGAATVKNLRLTASPRFGVHVGRNAELTLEGVIVEEATVAGVLVDGGGLLTASDVMVRRTAPSGSGEFGRGVNVSDGEATLRRAVLEDNRDLAFFAGGAETTLRLEDVVVRRTRSQESDGVGGRALEADGGATADLSRVLFEDNLDAALALTGADTFLRGSQLVIRSTGGRASDGTRGRGINLQSGARAELSKVLLERNGSIGVYAGGEGASLTLEDAIVRDTLGDPARGNFGHGVLIRQGATGDLARVHIARSRSIGLLVSTDATATIADLIVIDTRADGASGFFGRAVGVEMATLSLVRARLENSRDFGLFVSGGDVTMEDVVVRGVAGQEAEGKYGRGVEVNASGTLDFSRLLVEDARGFALGAIGSSSRVEGSALRVARLMPAACATGSCMGSAGGSGVVAAQGGAVTITRFGVDTAELCGVHVTEGSALDLTLGEVRECAIGACVQVEGYDLGRVNDGVRYADNGVNLDSTSLPVPEPGDAAPQP